MRLLLFLLGFWMATSQAQYVVGNGADGIIEGDRLFLRDLYERDLRDNSSFVEKINPEIVLEIMTFAKGQGTFLKELEISLLVKKLSELHEIDPCISTLLIKALKSYVWQFTETPLTLLPEAGVIRHFPDSQRVQIANRYLTSIHIHRGSWERLSSEHRVALIFHELFYGLSAIHPLTGSPVVGLVREIVGRFFQRPIDQDPNLSQLMRDLLDYGEGFSCSLQREVRVVVSKGTSLGSVLITKTSFTDLKNSASRKLFIKDSCSYLKYSQNQVYYVNFQWVQAASDLKVEFSRYAVGGEGFQYFLRLPWEQAHTPQLSYSGNDIWEQSRCEAQVDEFIMGQSARPQKVRSDRQ